MNWYRVDLHIHTALSPCADDQMTPPAIVDAALDAGLSMIAICDHNATGNVAAVQEAAAGDLVVLPGMEITTVEEVHVLGIFPHNDCAHLAAAHVRATLPHVRPGDEVRFGTQHLLDARGHEIGCETHLLACASTLSLDRAVLLIHRNHGLAIAAHVNRPAFGVMSQLGSFPREVDWDAIEVFSTRGVCPACADFEVYELPLITSSDSHFLDDIGSSQTTLAMEAPTFTELSLALRGAGGRCVHPEGPVVA